MSTKAKYITGLCMTKFGGIPAAICFPEAVGHDDMAHMFSEMWGAGFFHINTNGMATVYGESMSLNIKNRGADDEFILNRSLGIM